MSFIPEPEFFTFAQICNRWRIDISHLEHLVDDRNYLRPSLYLPRLRKRLGSAFALDSEQFKVMCDYFRDEAFLYLHVESTLLSPLKENIDLQSFDVDALKSILKNQLGEDRAGLQLVEIPNHIYRPREGGQQYAAQIHPHSYDLFPFCAIYEFFDSTKVMLFNTDGSLYVEDWEPVISKEERDRVEAIGGSTNGGEADKLKSLSTLRQYLARDFWVEEDIFYLLSGVAKNDGTGGLAGTYLDLETDDLVEDIMGSYALKFQNVESVWRHCVHPVESVARNPYNDDWLGYKVDYVLNWAREKQLDVSWLDWAFDSGLVRFSQCAVSSSGNGSSIDSLLPKLEATEVRAHKSELLEVLDAAVAEFWEGRDPDEASKRATNTAVAAWVNENYESVSEGEALIIARIMRPNKYKSKTLG